MFKNQQNVKFDDNGRMNIFEGMQKSDKWMILCHVYIMLRTKQNGIYSQKKKYIY